MNSRVDLDSEMLQKRRKANKNSHIHQLTLHSSLQASPFVSNDDETQTNKRKLTKNREIF